MSDSILAIHAYGATGLSIVSGTAAAVILTIGVFVFARGRSTPATVRFLAVTTVIAAWLAAFALSYASRNPQTSLFWGRMGLLPLMLLPAASLALSAAVSRPQRNAGVAMFASWVVCIASGLIAAFTPIVLTAVVYRPWGFQPAGGVGLVALGVIAAAVFLTALSFVWNTFRLREGDGSDRAGVLLLAFILGGAGFLDILPMLGTEVYPVGYIATFAFTIIAGVALAQFGYVELSPQYAASQILETIKSAVLLADMQGTIRVANRAAVQLLGYTPETIAELPMRTIFGDDEYSSTRRMLNSSGVLEQIMNWRTASGSSVDVLTSSSFIRGADGVPLGVVYVASDYTERKRAETALRESEYRYRTLFDANPLPMWVYDFESLRFVAVNDAAVRHYGYTREEFLEMSITEIRPQEDVPQVMALLPLLAERGGPATFRHMRKDGTIIHVDISSFEFRLTGRRMRLVIAQDVTERRSAEQRLRDSEARYRLLFERNLAGVYRTNVNGLVLDCNDAFARIFGYESRDEMLRHNARSLYFEAEDRERTIRQLHQQRALTNHEARMRRKDGAAVWVLENMTLLDGSSGEDDVIEGTVIDITDRKHALDRVEYQAWHDALTALPNRLLFRDRLNLALAHARRNSKMLAVMYLDLDGFKAINDSLGHTMGDRLLQAVATRLVDSVRSEDTVARMGGDEFTILLPDLAEGRGAATVAQKITEWVSNPVVIDEHVLHVTPSIGIALFPGDGFDADALLKSADRAMYRAKQLGRNNYQFATPPPFDDRAALQRRLSEALKKGEFLLHYQPIVDIGTGEIGAMEALLRWNDPDAGLRTPASFLAAAEDADVMTPLGEWILRTACAQARTWRSTMPSLRVCVNLFARQFQQRGITESIARIIEETGLPPSALQLEITEAAAMNNPEQSMAAMAELKALGVSLAIDDFGTGYSSFRYLRRLPIDTVKVDEEFVRGISGDPTDRAAVSALISMARSLGVHVVAEGVETIEELEFLRGEGCTEIQGFLHARPMPPADLEKLLASADASRRFQPPAG